MADFAYACFTKKALRWYEELDEDTQSDWKLFKRAILAKYAKPPQLPSIVPSSAYDVISPSVSIEFTPAAGPPTAVTVHRGRIRVDRQGNDGNGYLIRQIIGTTEILAMGSNNRSEASVFELDPIRRTITTQHGEARLVVRACSEGWSLEPGEASDAE
ncbi:hypothetical protein FRC01_003407 [Tulasnella sp. 417]|nr:hypothetical protein FRC01_003407 [Tulasnella sp. 417]